MEIDFGMEIGAEEVSFTQRLTLYLPNKDKHGQLLTNLPEWLKEAHELLSRIGSGSTAFPPADGTWLSEEAVLIWEETRIV